MAIALPQSVKEILQDKAYGHVITYNKDGKPQVTIEFSWQAPRLVKPGGPVSGTGLSCSRRVMGYATYRHRLET